jgi:signal transduction histidine kinase
VHQDEIARLAATVNAMLTRLEHSADRQRRFVGDAAHELRSPIASLRTQLETARERHHGPGIAALLPDLLEDTVRMQTLVDQLLLLARNDTGTTLPRTHPVDLDEVVDGVVATGRVGARVPVHVPSLEPGQVNGDADLLGHLVRNLVENAVRHADSIVEVSLRSEGEEAILIVDDDGPGIPPQHRQDIFGRFTRLDAGRGRDQGNVGLGLAIVADIVRLHGGRVDVDRSPLGGARFLVRIPLGTGVRVGVALDAERRLTPHRPSPRAARGR